MSELVRLTGLWKSKTKKGQGYLSGSLGSARIIIFQNDRKEGEKSPDYIVYLSPQKGKEDRKEEGQAGDGFPF